MNDEQALPSSASTATHTGASATAESRGASDLAASSTTNHELMATSAAPGLVERARDSSTATAPLQGVLTGVEGTNTRVILTEDDLLTRGLRADLEAVVAPVAFVGAFVLVLLKVRNLFKRPIPSTQTKGAPQP